MKYDFLPHVPNTIQRNFLYFYLFTRHRRLYSIDNRAIKIIQQKYKYTPKARVGTYRTNNEHT